MAIKPPHRTLDFEYFTAKDAAMAEQADYGLMLWDGESVGTLLPGSCRPGNQWCYMPLPVVRF
ncbi:MAG: hypothetical protein ACXW5U_05340 [Thermoanaerobaculia bacterium]